MIKFIENIGKTIVVLFAVFAVSYVVGLMVRVILDIIYP